MCSRKIIPLEDDEDLDYGKVAGLIYLRGLNMNDVCMYM
jgi:hypothetical protein